MLSFYNNFADLNSHLWQHFFSKRKKCNKKIIYHPAKMFQFNLIINLRKIFIIYENKQKDVVLFFHSSPSGII